LKYPRLKRIWPILAWYLVVCIGLVITLAPFLWAAAGSLKENHIIISEVDPFTIKAFFPGTSVDAYIGIFEKNFGRAIANTAFVSIVSVVIGLLLNSMAGFAFAQFRFKGRNAFFALVLLTFAVPSEAIAIPLFSMMRQLGWFDTFAALIVPNISNGLVIFLFRQFFLGIPKEMIEAARVDGLSWWRVYWTICMPLAKPVTIGAGLLLFVFQWESFLWPLIAAPSPELHLIQVALARFATEYSIIWNEQFAASTIAGSMPLIFIFLFQKQFVSALTGADLK
jgi:multiple sugar transport system permease protein/putative chitobiose transport system permease protein